MTIDLGTNKRIPGIGGIVRSGFLQLKSLVCLPGQVGASAKAREIAGQFVAMKGSTARMQGVPSWTSYNAIRDQLVQDGNLVESSDPQSYVFAEDVPFAGPSAAATVVRAGNVNGRVEWRTEGNRQTHQDWYEDKQGRRSGAG